MVKCFSIGVPVCYNILNSPDHLWAILRLHVRLGEIWSYCTTRLLWGHLPAFFCWLVRVCARNWVRICHPKQSHGAIRNNIDPVASGPSLATFTFPVTQFVFPAKFCFQFCLGSNNRALRIWKQNLCKILWGREITLWRTRKFPLPLFHLSPNLSFTCRAGFNSF